MRSRRKYKIINSETIFFVLPASVCVCVGACLTVLVDEHTYVCTKIYTDTVSVYEGERRMRPS